MHCPEPSYRAKSSGVVQEIISSRQKGPNTMKSDQVMRRMESLSPEGMAGQGTRHAEPRPEKAQGRCESFHWVLLKLHAQDQMVKDAGNTISVWV